MSEPFVRIVLAAIVMSLGWWVAGPVGLLLAGVLAAALLSRVVMQAFSGGVSMVRAAAYRPVEGSYYAYRGKPMDVVEDVDGHRWLRAADVRRVLASLPRDATLKNLEPERMSHMGPKGIGYLRADALTDWLSRAQGDEAIRFKRWVERDVRFPSPAARRAAPVSRGFASPEDEPR